MRSNIEGKIQNPNIKCQIKSKIQMTNQ